jgi:hypothetical protein
MDTDPIPADVLAEVLERIARAGWMRFSEMLAHTGGCARPVRLKGTTRRVEPDTGELSVSYDSASEPDGVLLKACQSRRATRCPACAATYRSDARALVLAGLVGGKGIPEDVAGHPLVFVTLTAPSFGAVHGEADPCHPKPYHCPCGRGHICVQVHEGGDPQLGRPLCADGYDYPASSSGTTGSPSSGDAPPSPPDATWPVYSVTRSETSISTTASPT